MFRRRHKPAPDGRSLSTLPPPPARGSVGAIDGGSVPDRPGSDDQLIRPQLWLPSGSREEGTGIEVTSEVPPDLVPPNERAETRRSPVRTLDVLDELTLVAANQHGLFTRSQFLASGGTARQLGSWATSGRAVRVLPTVWLMAGVPATWPCRLLGHCLASGGVASHRAAGRLLGLGDLAKADREISVPRSRNYRTDGVIVHQSRDVDLDDPVIIDGIPCTSPARTVLDLAQVLSPDEVEDVVDALIRSGQVTWEGLADCWVLHARRGRSGIGVIGDLIQRRAGEGDQPDSHPERRIIRLLLRDGIVDGQLHLRLYDDHGTLVVESDIGWAPPNPKVLLFYDSYEFHLNRRVFEADAEKRRLAQLMGYQVLAYTARSLYRTPWIIPAQVRQALGR